MPATSPPPRRFILGALRAFARGGYSGTTMEDIATEVGVTQPRISQVFAGKLSAYLDAHQVAMEVLTSELRAAATARKFNASTVHTVIAGLLDESPQVLMIIAHSLVPPAHEPSLVKVAAETLDQVTDLLQVDFHATPAQARQTVAEIVLTLVERAAHPTD